EQSHGGECRSVATSTLNLPRGQPAGKHEADREENTTPAGDTGSRSAILGYLGEHSDIGYFEESIGGSSQCVEQQHPDQSAAPVTEVRRRKQSDEADHEEHCAYGHERSAATPARVHPIGPATDQRISEKLNQLREQQRQSSCARWNG